jgi:hypothetical protein
MKFMLYCFLYHYHVRRRKGDGELTYRLDGPYANLLSSMQLFMYFTRNLYTKCTLNHNSIV